MISLQTKRLFDLPAENQEQDHVHNLKFWIEQHMGVD